MGCPCGTSEEYERCCRPLHDGHRHAATAEELMRSRYSAFAMARADYLLSTLTEPSSPGDRERVEQWAKSVAWLGLQIVDATETEVEFVARYLERDRVVSLRERSRFERRDGRWSYEGGVPAETSLRVGRNDPCPCQSGRKFKACHAGR